MSRGSKVKGSQFERDVCKQLSLWISNGTRDDLTWRSAMSGGRASVQFKKGESNITQAGDISSIDPISAMFINTFYIECRFYKDLNIASSFIKGNGKLREFWLEVIDKAEQAKRLPLLIARQNRMPTMALLSVKGGESLGLIKHIDALAMTYWNGLCYIYNFDFFLEKASPI